MSEPSIFDNVSAGCTHTFTLELIEIACQSQTIQDLFTDKNTNYLWNNYFGMHIDADKNYHFTYGNFLINLLKI